MSGLKRALRCTKTLKLFTDADWIENKKKNIKRSKSPRELPRCLHAYECVCRSATLCVWVCVCEWVSSSNVFFLFVHQETETFKVVLLLLFSLAKQVQPAHDHSGYSASTISCFRSLNRESSNTVKWDRTLPNSVPFAFPHVWK